MAIYKSTYCSPFLTSIDPRTALTGDDDTSTPVEYLQCKVDSSNKNVTGYRVRVLDGQNNEIFPGDGSTTISPISELQVSSLGYEVRGTNSGINGTFLKIPFFQNNKFRVGYNDLKKAGDPGDASYQAIYFNSDIMVDHLIYTGSSGGDAALPKNWNFLDDECTKLIYWWPSASGNFTVKIVEDSEVYQKFMLDSGTTFFYVEGSEQPDLEEYTKMVENRLTIGDEEILEGEVVGIVDTSEIPTTDSWYKTKTSFYKVTKELILDSANKTMGITTVLEKFSEKVCSSLGLEAGNSGSYVRICTRKGLTQHLITKQVTVKAGSAYILSDRSNEWSCLRWGNQTKSLNFTHTTYKWEVTLYQGTGTLNVSGDAPEITYDAAPDTDYDIIVATGSICGSNAQRIQIANQDPFDSFGNPVSGTVLPSQSDGVLVLQGTYAALGQNNTDSFAGANSIYVETYDSSYGHVYFTESEVTDLQIENAKYIQFFKHSTDPAQILDSDIVDWGISSNVELMVVDTKTGTKYSPGAESSVSVANRILIINSWTGTVSNLTSGQTVLLTGQTSKMTNGVYSYYTNGDYHCLKRAASYTSWSSYIGKIIYVQYGDLAGKNIQSLAGAGGSYSLWDPSTGTSGSSELWFAQEEPIVLFSSKLSSYNIEAYYTDTDIMPQDNPVVAGVDFSKFGGSSDHCLLLKEYKELYYWDGQGWHFLSLASDSDYYYIKGGDNNAGKIIKNWMVTYELSSAKIMHNTSKFTFISPSVNIQSGMRMKIQHSNGVYYFPIKYFDNTTYAISHPGVETKLTPLSSRSASAFLYEILSNFKNSDGNPFYCEYAPYLIIYKNGKVFNSLALIQGDEDNVVEQACYVTARSVKLSAQYINFQNVSWESYRWILRDSEGNIKQDSGKKYDKTIETTFYGLFNDDEGNVDYYASIYIEDETGNTVGETFKLVVIQGSAVSAQVPFSAEYVPNLQAIKLSYQDNGLFAPSLRSNVYTIDHEFIEDEELFDGSVCYSPTGSSTKKLAMLTHPENNFAPPIYYLPSTIYLEDDSDAKTDAESYSDNKLGKTEKLGLNYYRRFNNEEMEMEVETGHNLVLYPTTDSNGNSHTELYFETEFELGGNFQGQILSFDVQGEDSDSIKEPCVYEDGTTQDKTSYMTFVLSNGETSYVNNEKDEPVNRNRFVLSIQKDGKDTLSKTGNILSLFTTGDIKYYLQPSNKINSEYLPEDDDYKKIEFLKTIEGDRIYLINHNGTLYKPKQGHAIGNCCLFNSNDSGKSGPLSYWVEKQPVLGAADSEDTLMIDKYSQKYLNQRDSYSSGGVQLWPDSSGDYLEEDYVWEEDSSGEASWSSISEDTLKSHCTAMTPVKRHPEIETTKYKYRLICRIKDIEGLYSKLSSATISSAGSGSIEKWEIDSYMEITIEQLSGTNS